MRVAFTAWTPLHIINILNVQQNFYQDALCDLFVYNEFQNAEVIYQRIKEENIFEHVYLVQNGNNTSKFRKIYEVLLNNFTNYLSEPITNIHYDIFFIQGDNYFSKLLFAQAKHQNSNLELNYLEDGMGIYINPQVLDKDSRGHRYYSKLNRSSIYLNEFKHYFVYEPELVELEASFKRLPKLTLNNPVTVLISRIFDLSDNDRQLKDSVVFIEQPFEHELLNIDQELILKFFEKYQKSRSIKVKLHPRTFGERFNKQYEILETNLPWELYLIETDVINCLIVTVISTVAFTPFLIFGNDQKTVFLSDVLLSQRKELQLNHKTCKTLEKSSNLVRRFNRLSNGIISLPANIEELGKIISRT
ncbi:polysialyltransferase family glycosyltransferase [uncultured Vagococcus sp.]|uniref:polysialyltransferase family glycosyltransferase n=1 Tax=uncultured Vagococcus sp. TaxID=189676 RepID=UPI0028D0C463|nr:polysialyltransferase family glycosyltransferase [uncultured Vagococcus sp.]